MATTRTSSVRLTRFLLLIGDDLQPHHGLSRQAGVNERQVRAAEAVVPDVDHRLAARIIVHEGGHLAEVGRPEAALLEQRLDILRGQPGLLDSAVRHVSRRRVGPDDARREQH